MSSGRKRKPPTQAKQNLLQPKKSKVNNEAVEDIDTVVEYTKNVKFGPQIDPGDDQTILEELKDLRRNEDEKDNTEIEIKIKKGIVEDFTQIQIAINNALGMKNKELESKDVALNELLNERNDLVKSLQEIDSELKEREDDVKRQEEEIKTLKTSLKDANNLKSKKTEKNIKESKEMMGKLTKNVEHLTKLNIELTKENKTLKDAVNDQAIAIKKNHDDFKMFEEKVDRFKCSRDITIKMYKEEIAEKDMKLRELDMQTRSLKASVETVESENEKLRKLLKKTKEKQNEDIQIKNNALDNMQKLIDAEVNVSYKYKQEWIQRGQEISVKSEIVRQHKETIKKLKADNAELSSKMERHMKKSHERKIKLKSAQQSYRSNLNEFLEKYKKDIEYLKSKRDKEEPRKKKKILKVKSMKLILDENSTDNSVSMDLKSLAKVEDSIEQKLKSAEDKPDKDVQAENNECIDDLESDNFTSFILWDESAFSADNEMKANQERLKFKIVSRGKRIQYDTSTQETVKEETMIHDINSEEILDCSQNSLVANYVKDFVDELIDSILTSSLLSTVPSFHVHKDVKKEPNAGHDVVDETIDMILSCVVEQDKQPSLLCKI